MPTPSLRFADVLRHHGRDVLDRFVAKTRYRDLPPDDASRVAIEDHFPFFLKDLAALFEEGAPPPSSSWAAQEHGRQRWDAGYDLEATIREYTLLRDAVVDTATALGVVPNERELRLLADALNAGLSTAVQEFVAQRDRAVDAERARLASVLELLPTGVALLDEASEVVAANPAARAVLGLDEHGKLAAALRADEVDASVEVDVTTADGPHTVLVHRGPYTSYGTRKERVVSFSDVTRTRTEARLQRCLADAAEALSTRPEEGVPLEEVGRRVVDCVGAVFAIVPLGGARPAVAVATGDALEVRARLAALARATGDAPLEAGAVEGALADVGVDAAFVARVSGGAPDRDATLVVGIPHRVFVREPYATFTEGLATRVGLALDAAALYDGLQRAVRARDEVVAVVSHDLKNPLQVVRGALDELRLSRDDDATFERWASALDRAALRMQRLVVDLLDLARLDEGRFSLELVPTDVRALLESAAEHATPLTTKKQQAIRVVLEGASDGETQVLADGARLAQVFANLVDNALRHVPEGGHVALRAEVRERTVAFAVVDTGPGIAPERLPHLFDRFASDRKQAHGTGFGLAIAQGIVRAHGARLQVTSTLGEGATFGFELPRALPSEGASGAA